MPCFHKLSGLLFVALLVSGCPATPTRDAGSPEERLVFVELRSIAAGPNGDGGFVYEPPVAYTSIKLFSDEDDETPITGSYDGGRVVFEYVPTVDNIIEFRSPHASLPDTTYVERFETHRRDIYRGLSLWARQDVAHADAGIELSASFTGLRPWSNDEDFFYAYSSQASFARSWAPAGGALADGGTFITGMRINTDDMSADDWETNPLVDASRGDRLTIVQQRETWTTSLNGVALPSHNPWSGTWPLTSIASGDVPSPRFGRASPVSVTASLAPLPVTNKRLKVVADSLKLYMEELESPYTRLASANAIYFEPGGDGRLYLSPVPSIWEHTSRRSTYSPVNPACYPDFDGQCDAGCAACDSQVTLPLNHPSTVELPVALTHPFTDPGTEMLLTLWRTYTVVGVPDAGVFTLITRNTTVRPLPADTVVTATLSLSAPRGITTAGIEVSRTAETPAVIELRERTVIGTPWHFGVSWQAPRYGTVNYYWVNVIEHAAVDGEWGSFVVATVRTSGTSVTIPDGVFRPGHLYMVRVTAIEDTDDPDDRRTVSALQTTRSAEALTGIFTVR